MESVIQDKDGICHPYPRWQIYAPCIIRKLIIYTHIICNSTITSAPGHEHGYSGIVYGCTTGFTRTDLVSYT